ncbi:uncharacterized protein LOC144662970, partial [Oculina patagonica]
MTSNLLFCFVLISTWLVFTSSKTLCPRIFFQNINEETMPYKMIEGVYIKEGVYNFFPIYRREGDRDMGLYYQKDDKRLVIGDKIGYKRIFEFGMAVRLSGNPSSWLYSSGGLDRSDVFSGLVQQWQYYNRRDRAYHNVPTTASSPMIKAVCVDEDFRECNSDRVYLNERIDGHNDPTTDYFYRVEGLFLNLRPVYTHSVMSWYLQYVNSYWVIKQYHSPINTEENVFMRVKDFALRPEYITNMWSHKSYHGGWRDMPSLRVLCRGVRSMSNICPSNPCNLHDRRATCVYTSGNETLCLCTSGFMGKACSVKKQ